MYAKKSSSELKDLAKGRLIGHYAIPMGGFVISVLITFLVLMVLEFMFRLNSYESIALYSIASFIVSLLLSVLLVGNQVIILKLSRGIPAGIQDLFYGFSHQPDRVILLSLLLSLIAIGCLLPGGILLFASFHLESLLLAALGILVLLGGIVVAYVLTLSYSQVMYIYIENPDMRVFDIMRESKRMMTGNKGRYFYLMLSFIGLELLSVLSCYIGLLWLNPYMETTNAFFYLNLKGEV